MKNKFLAMLTILPSLFSTTSCVRYDWDTNNWINLDLDAKHPFGSYNNMKLEIYKSSTLQESYTCSDWGTVDLFIEHIESQKVSPFVVDLPSEVYIYTVKIELNGEDDGEIYASNLEYYLSLDGIKGYLVQDGDAHVTYDEFMSNLFTLIEETADNLTKFNWT